MRTLRRAVPGILMLLCTLAGVHAESDRTVHLKIQLYDQTLYYEGDTVSIRVTIANDSPDIYRFRLADRRQFNLDFLIAAQDNRKPRESDKFITMLNDDKPIYARDVSILPGEEYSFVETLDDYLVCQSGIHTLSALFYPELRGQAQEQTRLVSNRLSLDIRPAARKKRQVEDQLKLDTQEVLQQQRLSPDEVIVHTVQALQDHRLEAWQLYLDVEKLYNNDPVARARYLRLDEASRLQEMDRYRQDLWKNLTTGSYPQIPTELRIIHTDYDNNTATVVTQQDFNEGSLKVTKEYIYKLEKRGGIWYIIQYNVNNKGRK